MPTSTTFCSSWFNRRLTVKFIACFLGFGIESCNKKVRKTSLLFDSIDTLQSTGNFSLFNANNQTFAKALIKQHRQCIYIHVLVQVVVRVSKLNFPMKHSLLMDWTALWLICLNKKYWTDEYPRVQLRSQANIERAGRDQSPVYCFECEQSFQSTFFVCHCCCRWLFTNSPC